jgi:predicted alpha/beta hydrolase family esterase
MRAADCDILIVPGLDDSGPDHWQSRWQRSLSTARRVAQDDWTCADRERWVARLVEEVARSTRPAVLVGHSCGVLTIAHAAAELAGSAVRGAFLVGPTGETAIHAIAAIDSSFAPIPRAPFPFPSVLVASATDPYCPLAEAEDLAFAWGAAFTPAGDAGHINTASGHGPWPEGSMRFAMFLKTLGG